MRAYRGMQNPAHKGLRGVPSYTTSLDVALIWSARPGDIWARRGAQLLSTSTVRAVDLHFSRLLELGDDQYPYIEFQEVLQKLQFGQPNGLTHEEALRILQYLHNRVIGKARGGEFQYLYFDEDGNEPMDDDEVPFSLRNPQTLISWQVMSDFDDGYMTPHEAAKRLLADAFIFADSPAFQKVARRLGYDGVMYADAFSGCDNAAEAVLGKDCHDVEGVWQETDLEDDYIWLHTTYRPLQKMKVPVLWEALSENLLRIDPQEIQMGVAEEMEHTADEGIARVIAWDHLVEDPHYYTKLKRAGL